MLRILENIHVDPTRDPDPKPTEKEDPDKKKSFPIHITALTEQKRAGEYFDAEGAVGL